MNIQFPLLLDGATGTELQKLGFTGEVCAEQWILEHPDAILQTQRAYVEAGSRVLYTPTFGANRAKLAEHGLGGRTEEYNRRLAALTKEAAAGRVLVAGDLAPTGHFLAPAGDRRFEELVEDYAGQAAALEAAGVDLFVVETMMTLADARAAMLAIRRVSRRPVFVSFSCDRSGRSVGGTDVAAALLVMEGMGAAAFGLNCSTGPEEMLPQLQRLHEYASIPLMAKPNAGLPETIGGRCVYRCTPEQFAAQTEAFAAAGVGAFGGCCGTTASHIAALGARLETLVPAAPAPRWGDCLPCATERRAFPLPADAACGAPVSASELEERLDELLEDETPVLSVSIASEAELADFEDIQYALTKPLCLCCDDGALLERALRLYQGRALYDGALDDAALAPLAETYGLIL